MRKKQKFQVKSFRFKRFERKSYSAYNSMHKAVTIGVVSIMTLTFSNVAKSQNNTPTSHEAYLQEKTLDEVVVQDSSLLPINQVGRNNVIVLTAKEIDDLKVQSIEELLSTVASVDIQTRGTHGVQADVSLRGGNFDQTAILIDGINVSNPQTGHYSLDIPINLSDIERIEIIKGPSAIIYGASALSGGINIITKKNTNNQISTLAEIGQNNFANIATSISKKIANTENTLSFGYKTSSGYITNSAYDIYNVLYRNRINLNENKIDFSLGYNYKDYDANTFYSAKYPNQHDETSSLLFSAKGLFVLFNQQLKFVPSLYYNLHTDNYHLIKNSAIGHNHHNSNVAGMNIGFQYVKTKYSLNFGSDIRYEDILSNTIGKPTHILHDRYFNHYKQRTNISYFLQTNYSYNDFVASLGLISFYNTSIKQDKVNLYPSLTLSYRFNPHWDIYASFTSASRLPTFTELYYSDAIHKANPNLSQEKSLSYDFGLNHKNRYFLSSFFAYYTMANNLIDWTQENISTGLWTCKNINELSKYGADFSLKIFLNELTDIFQNNTNLTFSYSYLRTDKTKNNYISQYAFNYLKHKLTFNFHLPFMNSLCLDVDGKYCVRQGEYVSYNTNPSGENKKYSPFFTMDINLNYQINKFSDIYVKVANLFNKEYYEIGNIPQAQRWIIVGTKIIIN